MGVSFFINMFVVEEEREEAGCLLRWVILQYSHFFMGMVSTQFLTIVTIICDITI